MLGRLAGEMPQILRALASLPEKCSYCASVSRQTQSLYSYYHVIVRHGVHTPIILRLCNIILPVSLLRKLSFYKLHCLILFFSNKKLCTISTTDTSFRYKPFPHLPYFQEKKRSFCLQQDRSLDFDTLANILMQFYLIKVPV